MNSALSKANSYIFAEEIKKAKDEFIVTNGICTGKVRGLFKSTEYYLYYK